MKKYIYKSLALFLAVTSLTSCLKDDSLVLDPAKGHNVIEFANPSQIVANGTPSPLYSFSYDATATPVLPITVSYSGPEATAPQDITVKIAVGSEAKITEYNTATTSAFSMLGSSAYTISATEVVIKAGTSKATFNVTFKPSSFDFAKSEVLPLTITSVSSGIISGNFNTILLNVAAKNKYDGVYDLDMIASGAPERTNVYQGGTSFKWPGHVELRTSGATVVDIYDDVYNWGGGISQWILLLPAAPAAPATLPTGGAGFGQARPRFTLDPTTNKVTAVVNGFLNPTNGRAFAIDPNFNSTYDPATKTIDVGFLFTQPSFNTLKVRYTFKYVSAR